MHAITPLRAISLSYPNYLKLSIEQLQRLIKTLNKSDKFWCLLEIKKRQNKFKNFNNKITK